MARTRIRGENVEVLVIVNGEPQFALNNIKSMSIEENISTQEEQYLNETTNRFDELYSGASGSLDLDKDSPAVFDFIGIIKGRARRDPQFLGTKINVKATLNYPTGEVKLAILEDVFFDRIPVSFNGRQQYGSVRLSFKCSEISYV